MDRIESDSQLLREAQAQGRGATLRAYVRLSGPGWLQSAMTLGGGSLASSLYLGILAGSSLMWLQPLAMAIGIIMLSAIGYVTLSTGQRPFRAIREHVNPVLGWSWALAVAAANVVWCLPQYSLAYGVLSRNLLPGFLSDQGWLRTRMLAAAGEAPGTLHWLADHSHQLLVVTVLLVVATAITWSYDRGGWGIRLYETILKTMVGVIVFCFIGVVAVLAWNRGSLLWEGVLQGFVPDLGQFFRPTATMQRVLADIQHAAARQYWTDFVVDKQRDVIISAVATAVGINMTFLYPYSLLRKGWRREFRGLAIFDLATGMFIPYVLATGCVVIAAGAQFHTRLTQDFVVDEAAQTIEVPQRFSAQYERFVAGRQAVLEDPLELSERKLAAMLVDRHANDLSESLNELTGPLVGNYIFGLGVLAMTLSTITLLMLISGFVVSEMLGVPPGGWTHRIGSLLAGIGGMFGPFVWGGEQASFYLAVPTSVFGFVLLPFAYVTFMLLLNQRRLLGEHRPRGWRRFVWNGLMGLAASLATAGSIYMIYVKAGTVGMIAVAAFILLALVVQINRYNESLAARRSSTAEEIPPAGSTGTAENTPRRPPQA
jgi:Mn2+/Fe2+ NRAMP family transporter